MSQNTEVIERHVFISNRKEREVYLTVLEKVFSYPLDEIAVSYVDKPDEVFSTINDRTRKILLNLPKPEKITEISGIFSEGGSFMLQNGNLHVHVREDEYNYELIVSLKSFLGFIFPLWIFKNPYIWGATIFETYERQHFFDSRSYSFRSKLLEEPEIDIYRRDDGIIHKYRFYLREDLDPEEGMKHIEPYFKNLQDGLRKRNYEPLEVLYTYCSDKRKFRKMEPRTKLGKDIKSILNPVK